MFRIIEAVNHRKSVTLAIGQAGADQTARLFPDPGFTVFDDIAVDRGLLHHVGEIDVVHRRHAAAWMADAKVTLEQFELFHGRPGAAQRRNQIGVALEIALLRGRCVKLLCHHPHRNAGVTINARRPIGHRLTAAKADPAQRIVQRIGMRALELGKDLPFAPPRQIGARRRARHEEPGKANRCRHRWRDPLAILPAGSCARRLTMPPPAQR